MTTDTDPGQTIGHPHNILPLDDDEAKHLKQVPKDVARLLLLGNTGAILSAICISETPSLKDINASSPVFIKALLASKCANLLRFTTTGLSTGYYAGAAILLRAAFESLAYSFLFHDDENEVKLWLKLELHPSMDAADRDWERHAQIKRSKDSFTRHAPDMKEEKDLIRFLWDRTSTDIHNSVAGLAQGFGLDFGSFLPDEFWTMLEKSGDDWGFALNMLAWKSVDRRTWSSTKKTAPVNKEKVRLEFMGRYDANELRLLSAIGLFLSHRLGDFVFDIFEARSPSLRADFNAWHKEVKKK